MAFADINSVNRLLNNFGLGSDWNIRPCKIIFPGTGLASSRTITFIDVGNVLQNIDLGVVPTASLAQGLIFDQLSQSSADSSGRTKTTNLTSSLKNNIIKYQLADGNEITRNWGKKTTDFNITTLIAGSGYTNKIQEIAQLFQQDTGLEGAIFEHPILGSFTGVAVESVTFNESFKAFNATFCNIQLSCTSVYNKDTVQKEPISNTVLNYINDILSVIQTLESIVNLKEEIRASLQPLSIIAKAPNYNKVSTSPGKLSFEFDKVNYTNSNIGLVYTGGSSYSNPEIIKISNLFASRNIDINFDLNLTIDTILDLICRSLNIIVNGFGSGFITNTVDTTEYLININNLIYNSDSFNDFGNRVVVTRNVESYKDGIYTVNVKTTTFISTLDYSYTYAQNLINDVINYLTIVEVLVPENYSLYTALISNLESMYDFAYNRSNNNIKINIPTTILSLSVELGVETKDILDINPQLIGSKILQNGMIIIKPSDN